MMQSNTHPLHARRAQECCFLTSSSPTIGYQGAPDLVLTPSIKHVRRDFAVLVLMFDPAEHGVQDVS